MQTQSAPPQTDPTAVMGRRIVAFLIDVAIGIAIAFILFFAIAETATLGSPSQASTVCDAIREDNSFNFCMNFGSTVYATESSDTGLIWLVMLAYGVFFHFLLPGVSGYSIGKAVMGLRIVKQSDGQLAGIGANGVRWIIGLFEVLFCFLVGLITSLTSKGHRRLGDMAGGTFVVDKSEVGVAPVVAGLTAPETPPAAWAPPAPSTPQPDGGWASAPPAAPPTAESAAPPTGSAVPPAFPPPSTPPVSDPAAFPAPGSDEATTSLPAAGADEPTTTMPAAGEREQLPDRPAEESTTPEPAAAEPAPVGVDAPHWDDARNTYIQWDPELGQWMEWSETQGVWVPIST